MSAPQHDHEIFHVPVLMEIVASYLSSRELRSFEEFISHAQPPELGLLNFLSAPIATVSESKLGYQYCGHHPEITPELSELTPPSVKLSSIETYFSVPKNKAPLLDELRKKLYDLKLTKTAQPIPKTEEKETEIKLDPRTQYLVSGCSKYYTDDVVVLLQVALRNEIGRAHV